MTLAAPDCEDRVRGAIVGAALGDAIAARLAGDQQPNEYRVVEVMWGHDPLPFGDDTAAMLAVAAALTDGDQTHLRDPAPLITLVPLVLLRQGTDDALAAPRSSPADRARWRRVARALLAAMDGPPRRAAGQPQHGAGASRGAADLSHLFAPDISDDIATVIRTTITAPDEAITPAIAGAIVGAHVGLTGLPVALVERLDGLDRLLVAADSLALRSRGGASRSG